MKTLLITPPLLQPNTPYAATPLLTAYLRSQGHAAEQADLSLELLLKLFSREGIRTLCRELDGCEEAAGFLDQAEAYQDAVEPVIAFLQGRGAIPDCELPEGPHLARALDQEEQLGWNFRGADAADRARYLCSLVLDDIAEAARLLDPHFGFSRYAESLAVSLPDFEPLRRELEENDSLFIRWLDEVTDEAVAAHDPDLVVLTVPFPGCLFGALAVARRIRQLRPAVQIALGGGYVNTELRELADPGIFDYVDFVALDSGMVPLSRLAAGKAPVRTFVREGRTVRFLDAEAPPALQDRLPPPTYDGLPLERYFGLFEVLNPVTRLWSDGRWNRLVLAHGCCWSRCAFCDTTVDYVCRYDPASPSTVCDWMEALIDETGYSGFHFVDEALPPDLLDGLCDEILRRGLQVEWWGNIRFEKRFSPELVRKMAAAGCIAVTGGLETCCDRTLKLMRKGIAVASAADVLRRLAGAGILTHAYLMYGFPTQTREETFRALETVRDLIGEGALHSAFWHRFALTAHSEISRDPARFGIRPAKLPPASFARNEIPFDGGFDYDLDAVGASLRTATYNYLLGLGLDRPAGEW